MANKGTVRGYLVAGLLSLCFVLVSPITLFVVFLSGDSCCGENTTGTMAAVTVVIVALFTAVGGALAVAPRHPVKRPGYRVLVGWAIIAGPFALIHAAFVTLISIVAF